MHVYSDIEDMVEVGDVADGQAQDLNLGELLVGRQRGQQLTELREGHVEGLDTHALPGGMRSAVLEGGTAAAATFLLSHTQQCVPLPVIIIMIMMIKMVTFMRDCVMLSTWGPC